MHATPHRRGNAGVVGKDSVDRLAGRVTRATEDCLQRAGLRSSQAFAGRGRSLRATYHRGGIEAAGSRVVDHSVAQSVERVALLEHTVRDCFQLVIGKSTLEIGLAAAGRIAFRRDACDGLQAPHLIYGDTS